MTNNEHSTPAQRAAIVNEVADWLETHGWIRGLMSQRNQDGGYSYCTLGALTKVEENWGVRVEVEKSLSCALGSVAQTKGNERSPRVARWNDRHRNGANVIAKLRAAAEKIKTGEC